MKGKKKGERKPMGTAGMAGASRPEAHGLPEQGNVIVRCFVVLGPEDIRDTTKRAKRIRGMTHCLRTMLNHYAREEGDNASA